MPPKKATSAAPKKGAAPASHASYKDMIKEAILNLKERSGSSRQAIKKYVQSNNTINVSPPQFDSLFNRALKTGVESKDFTQPKGPSGPVKLAKKEAKPAAAKPAPKKAAPKAAATKKAAPKKPAAKKAAPKKAAAKPKAAPAVEAKPKVLAKTKSGRVTKTPAKPAAKKAAPKKPAAKKAAPKKTATPKKA